MGVYSLGCRMEVYSLGCGMGVYILGCRMERTLYNEAMRVLVSGSVVHGLMFRIQGSGSRV